MRYLFILPFFLSIFLLPVLEGNDVVTQAALIGRIYVMTLLSDGSLTDKNIVADINYFSRPYLHPYDHDRLAAILAEDSEKRVSAFQVYVTYSALKAQYNNALHKKLFGSPQGEKQYLSLQAPIAYELYIATFKKIADLKKQRVLCYSHEIFV